jgi:hypothetical protein
MFPAAPVDKQTHTESGIFFQFDTAASMWRQGSKEGVVDAGGKIGTIISWASSVEDPPHFLRCDGSVFDAAIYPELMAILGDNHTPNLDTDFIWFRNDTAPNTWYRQVHGRPGGLRATGSSSIGNPSSHHTHKIVDHRYTVGWQDSSPRPYMTTGTSDLSGPGGANHTHTVTFDLNVISGGDSETRPANIGVIFLIRAANP